MSSGTRIVLLGRQGAGKGTQCLRLSRHYVVPHISTGDMLRAAVREDSALGRSVEKIIGGGGLVSDELIIEVVRERLNSNVDTFWMASREQWCKQKPSISLLKISPY
jgi:adenylate kinase